MRTGLTKACPCCFPLPSQAAANDFSLEEQLLRMEPETIHVSGESAARSGSPARLFAAAVDRVRRPENTRILAAMLRNFDPRDTVTLAERLIRRTGDAETHRYAVQEAFERTAAPRGSRHHPTAVIAGLLRHVGNTSRDPRAALILLKALIRDADACFTQRSAALVAGAMREASDADVQLAAARELVSGPYGNGLVRKLETALRGMTSARAYHALFRDLLDLRTPLGRWRVGESTDIEQAFKRRLLEKREDDHLDPLLTDSDFSAVPKTLFAEPASPFFQDIEFFRELHDRAHSPAVSAALAQCLPLIRLRHRQSAHLFRHLLNGASDASPVEHHTALLLALSKTLGRIRLSPAEHYAAAHTLMERSADRDVWKVLLSALPLKVQDVNASVLAGRSEEHRRNMDLIRLLPPTLEHDPELAPHLRQARLRVDRLQPRAASWG